jgi:hypothetical protein
MYFCANLGAPALSIPHSGAPTGVVVNLETPAKKFTKPTGQTVYRQIV